MQLTLEVAFKRARIFSLPLAYSLLLDLSIIQLSVCQLYAQSLQFSAQEGSDNYQ